MPTSEDASWGIGITYLLYQDIVGVTPANLQPLLGLLAFLTDAGERNRRYVPDDRLLRKFEVEVREQRGQDDL